MDKMDFEAQMETGMTSLQRGVGVTPGSTFGESKMQQINSNIKFGLNAENISFGEEDFWKNLRWRTLRENMTDQDEKTFRIGSGIDGSNISIRKTDLMSGIDPDVKVISRKAKKQKDDKLLAHMAAERPIIIQNPNIPQVSKNIFKRKMDQLKGMSREQAYLNTSLTADERRAL